MTWNSYILFNTCTDVLNILILIDILPENKELSNKIKKLKMSLIMCNETSQPNVLCVASICHVIHLPPPKIVPVSTVA